MHRETVYYNREVRNKSIGLIFLPQLFFTFYFTGLERVSKQKENAQRHWQSIHDAGHIKQGLAALRHHNAKRKKNESQNCRKKKKCARHLQSCIIVQHKNHIILWIRTASRRARHIFFSVLANVSSSMLYLFTGVALHNS